MDVLVRTLVQKRVNRSMDLVKIGDQHCFATFLLFRGPQEYEFCLFLRQDFTLGLETPSIEGQRRRTLPQIFFPESVISFCEGFESFTHSVQMQFYTLHKKLFSDASHIPAVVLILSGRSQRYSPGHPMDLDTNCLVHLPCWYCDEHYRFVLLDRSVAMESAGIKSVELRNEVTCNIPNVWSQVHRSVLLGYP